MNKCCRCIPQCGVCSKTQKGKLWIIIEVNGRNTTRQNINYTDGNDLAIKDVVLMK